MNISSDSGKVELVFEKKLPDDQWSSIGQLLDKHNKYVPDKDFSEWQLLSPCCLFFQLTSLLLFFDLLCKFETRIFHDVCSRLWLNFKVKVVLKVILL